MASGLPAVATNVGGNPEIVRHEREGLLFPRGDFAACGFALRRLFQDPALAAKLGAVGRQRVLEHYRLDRTVEQYDRLYHRLVNV
jgi:glycosyltransferase involved in cell wall biosynthesis